MVHRMTVAPLSASYVDLVPDFWRLSPRFSATQSPKSGGMLLSHKENIIVKLCCHGNMEYLSDFVD